MSDMRLIVAGAGGRMGRTLVKAIAETQGLRAGRRAGRRALAADRLGCRHARRACRKWRQARSATPAPLIGEGRRHRRFHRAGGDRRALPRSPPRHGKVHIIGTTGLDAPTTKPRSRTPRKTRVIVKSGNMSLGVNLLAALTRRVAKTLDESFDIEILEMHHNQKVDAPSGTALLLGRAAAEGRGVDLDKHPSRAATAIPARASRATSALPRCAAAAWSASTA